MIRPAPVCVLITAALTIVGLAVGCSAGPPGAPPVSSSSPTSVPSTPSLTVTQSATETAVPEITTTNTLPPPPPETAPPPTRSGALTARSLPVPHGWRTVAPKGSEEDGYRGNGTWVLGRDPRYAAQDSIAMGCAPVTRDDYPDPVSALEGHYQRGRQPGIGLALQFSSADRAAAYLDAYRRQLTACTDPEVLMAEVTSSDVAVIDRRRYADQGEWTEVTRQVGARVTIVLLSDPGHQITAQQIAALSDQIAAVSNR